MAHHRRNATRAQMAFRVLLALAVAGATAYVGRDVLTADVYSANAEQSWVEPMPLAEAPVPEPWGTATRAPVPAPVPDAAEGNTAPRESAGEAPEENGRGDSLPADAVAMAVDAAEEATEAAELEAVKAQARGDTGGDPEPVYSADDAEARKSNSKGGEAPMSDVAGMQTKGTVEMETVPKAAASCAPRK